MNTHAKNPFTNARDAPEKTPLALAGLACKRAAHILFQFPLESIVIKHIHTTFHEVRHNGCTYHATVHCMGNEFCIVFTSFPSYAKQSIARVVLTKPNHNATA